MNSPEPSVVWNEADSKGPNWFVGYLHVFSAQTVTTLKSSNPVVYSFHAKLITAEPNIVVR